MKVVFEMKRPSWISQNLWHLRASTVDQGKSVRKLIKYKKAPGFHPQPRQKRTLFQGILKGGSIIVPLTFCLTCLESAV